MKKIQPLMLLALLAIAAPTAVLAQNYQDPNEQYNREQQNRHQDGQIANQKALEKELNDQVHQRSMERIGEQNETSGSGSAASSSPATRMMAAAAAIAIVAAIQAGRAPDQAAYAQHVMRSRMGFIYQRCSESRNQQMNEKRRKAGDDRYMARLRADRRAEAAAQAELDNQQREQAALNQTCQCLMGRSIQELTDAEWDLLAANQGAEQPWKSLPAARGRAVYEACTATQLAGQDSSWMFAGSGR